MEWSIVCCVVLVLLSTAVADNILTIERISKDALLVQEGQTVEIRVGVKATHDVKVKWYKAGGVLLTPTRLYRIEYKDSVAILKIKGIDRYLSGTYSLRVQDGVRVLWVNTSVTVEVVPIARYRIVTNLAPREPAAKQILNWTRQKNFTADKISVKDTGKWRFTACDVSVSQDGAEKSYDQCENFTSLSGSRRELLLREASGLEDLTTVRLLLMMGATASTGRQISRSHKNVKVVGTREWFCINKIDASIMIQLMNSSAKHARVRPDAAMNLKPLERVQNDSLNTCPISLSRRVQVVSRNTPDYTPLHYAAFQNNPSVVKHLLTAGSYVNARGYYNDTPLLLAAYKNSSSTCRLLLNSGAEVNVADDQGFTPLHLAAKFGHISNTELFVKRGAFVNIPDKNGNTPLHLSAKFCHLSVVVYLIRSGADVNMKNLMGQTPLHISAISRHVSIMLYLILNGSDVTVADVWGMTPVKIAGKDWWERIVKVLH